MEMVFISTLKTGRKGFKVLWQTVSGTSSSNQKCWVIHGRKNAIEN